MTPCTVRRFVLLTTPTAGRGTPWLPSWRCFCCLCLPFASFLLTVLQPLLRPTQASSTPTGTTTDAAAATIPPRLVMRVLPALLAMWAGLRGLITLLFVFRVYRDGASCQRLDYHPFTRENLHVDLATVNSSHPGYYRNSVPRYDEMYLHPRARAEDSSSGDSLQQQQQQPQTLHPLVVALVQYSDADPTSPGVQQMVRANMAYCQRHGYTYINGAEWFGSSSWRTWKVPGMELPPEHALLVDQAHSYYSKHLLIHSVSRKFDWVMYLDSDATITNMDVSLERYIRPAEHTGAHAILAIEGLHSHVMVRASCAHVLRVLSLFG
jgi:hypothetical protein